MKTSLYKSFLVLTLFLSFAGFAFAQTEREKGVELFKQGKNKEAVAVLEKASKKRKPKRTPKFGIFWVLLI